MLAVAVSDSWHGRPDSPGITINGLTQRCAHYPGARRFAAAFAVLLRQFSHQAADPASGPRQTNKSTHRCGETTGRDVKFGHLRVRRNRLPVPGTGWGGVVRFATGSHDRPTAGRKCQSTRSCTARNRYRYQCHLGGAWGEVLLHPEEPQTVFTIWLR